MRRSSQDQYLSPRTIQTFGILLVLGIAVAGVFGKGNATILLAVLGLAGGFVLLGGFYEKIKSDVLKAVQPPEQDRERR